MSLKLKNLFPGKCKNSPYSSSVPSAFRLICKSWSTSGRRVQMSEPLGKKSRPTRASSTLDLPLLWLPTTATWGSSIVDELPSWANMSCSLLTIGITVWPKGEAVEGEDWDGEEDGTCSSAIDWYWDRDFRLGRNCVCNWGCREFWRKWNPRTMWVLRLMRERTSFEIIFRERKNTDGADFLPPNKKKDGDTDFFFLFLIGQVWYLY